MDGWEFVQQLINSGPDRRWPVAGSFEVTCRCNLRCLPCYIRVKEGTNKAIEDELSHSEVIRILDELADHGCLGILFTGGEPLIRDDFTALYIHSKRKGLITSLFTNGTLIDPHTADMLAEWPPQTVEITLYGRSEKVYEKVTGVSGSYSRCFRGIELLLERKVPLALKATLVTANMHEVWDLKKLAAELGVEFRFDPVINPRLDRDKSPLDFRISPEEVLALELKDAERMNGLKKFVQRFEGPPSAPDDLYFCQAGLTGFHIDSQGRLSPCLMSRHPSYDLRTGTFREGWASFLPTVVRKKRERVSPCQRCHLHAICDYCPGWAELEGDDPELPVDHLCRLAHLRAHALGVGCGERNKTDDLFNRQHSIKTKVHETSDGKSGICSRGGGV